LWLSIHDIGFLNHLLLGITLLLLGRLPGLELVGIHLLDYLEHYLLLWLLEVVRVDKEGLGVHCWVLEILSGRTMP
jgi:hypothetical protein